MSVLAAAHTPYTVPLAMIDALQITILVLVAAGATAVVLIREPVRQVLALTVYGVLLAVLFLAFQAPDVTLSELTVVFLLTSGGPVDQTQVLANYALQVGVSGSQLGEGAAIALFLLPVLIILTIFALRSIARRESA